jgi:hypothetical protein
MEALQGEVKRIAGLELGRRIQRGALCESFLVAE